MKSATAEQEAKPTGFYRFVNQSSKQDSFFIFGKSPSIVTLTTGGDAGPSTILAMLTFAFFALVGGLLLNLMPCVFPILSLKVFELGKVLPETLFLLVQL
jgi:thiol:disulfide interchange protein